MHRPWPTVAALRACQPLTGILEKSSTIKDF